MPTSRKSAAKPSSGVMANIVAQGQENVARLEATFADAAVTEVATDYLRESLANPRHHISPASVEEMANGIRQADGRILQPLLVRPMAQDAEGRRFEVICGNRRLLAARRLGLPKVPVRVLEMDDEQAARYALWENLSREDLNPMDIAESIDGLRRVEQLTWDSIGERFGFSRQWGWKQQKLAELPEPVRVLVRDGELSPSKAMLLAQVTDGPEGILEAAHRTVTCGLSHRALQKELTARRKHVLTSPLAGSAVLDSTMPEHAIEETSNHTGRKHVFTWDPPMGRAKRGEARLTRATRELVGLVNQNLMRPEYARSLRPLAERILELAAENAPPDKPKRSDQEQAELIDPNYSP